MKLRQSVLASLLVVIVLLLVMVAFNYINDDFVQNIKSELKTNNISINVEDVLPEKTQFFCVLGEYETKENLKWKLEELGKYKFHPIGRLILKFNMLFMDGKYIIFLVSENGIIEQFKINDFFVLDNVQYSFELLPSEENFCYKLQDKKIVVEHNKYTTTLKLR